MNLPRIVRFPSALASIALLVLCCNQNAHAQTFDLQIVEQSGNSVPDGSGDAFVGAFDNVVVSNAGVAFTADLDGTTEGLFFNDGMTTSLIARTGDNAPGDFSGSINGNFAVFDDPFLPDGNQQVFLNNSGQIAFKVELANTDNADTDIPGILDAEGIFLFDGSEIRSVYRQSQLSFSQAPEAQFPGTPPEPGGLGFFNGPFLNSSGQLLFSNALTGVLDENGDFQPTPTDVNAVLSIGDGTAAGSVTIARQTQLLTGVTGITDAAIGSTILFNQLAFNDGGNALFQTDVTGTDDATGLELNTGNNNNVALVTTSDGANFNIIARRGDALPDRDGSFGSFSATSLNNNDQAIFLASNLGGTSGADDTYGIFAYDPNGGLSEIVVGGSDVPGDPGSFDEIEVLSITDLTDSGRFAFFANLETDGETNNDRAIYVGDINTGEIIQVAREGQFFGDGANDFFGAISPDFPDTGISTDDALSINEAGQIVFSANFIGVEQFTGGDVESGIFFYDPELGLQEVVRSGIGFGGDTLTSFFNSDSDLDGFALDESGRIAFTFELEDGSTGVAFASINAVPEPSTLVLLALTSLPLATRRRRK